MTSMVGNLSQGEKFAHVKLQVADVMEKLNRLTAECEQLFHADISAFHKYMEALKLPKRTEEQKLLRENALLAASMKAIEVPLRLMEVCKNGLLCVYNIAESSNKNVISDLGIGALLFEAAAQSALLTIEINLVSLKDGALKRQFAHKVSLLISEIEELKNKSLQITRKRIMQ